MKNTFILFALITVAGVGALNAATVVATVGSLPITDTDITARTKLMARQGEISTDNRNRALVNLIDDQIKLEYAANFKSVPTDKEVEKEFKTMNLSDLTATERAAAKKAIGANIAWQTIIARTIMPTIEVEDAEVSSEKTALERDRGLPIELTIVRLISIPEEVAAKLTKPKSCDDAVSMAEKLGGAPQKFTAVQYELAPEIRAQTATLPILTWSPRTDSSVLLVCAKKKTKEYGKIDDMIKQNAIFKKASFVADGQLKQLRRKSVIVIKDDKYKI